MHAMNVVPERLPKLGNVHLPPATVVPLVVSSVHLLQQHPNSVDAAVFYLTLGAVCLLLENMAGSVATWVLLSPVVVTCMMGMSFHAVGDTFLRANRRSRRPSVGRTTSQ
jgi:hypothetical protein